MANPLHSLQVVYERLRQNDSNYNSFSTNSNLISFTNAQAVELGLALQGNTVVEKIFININELSLAGTGELAHYVATSSSLKEFHMIGPNGVRGLHIFQLMAVVDRFLSAVTYNGNLRSIDIPYVFSSVPLALALQANCNSLTDVILHFRYLIEVPDTQRLINEAEIVAGMVGALHNLEAIEINSVQEYCFAASTIHKLMNHPTLQKLVLNLLYLEIYAPIYAYVLQDLFRSTTPLIDVHIIYDSSLNELAEVFPITFSGFDGHKSIRNLTLDIHTKNDENALAICDLLRNNPGITDLVVRVDTLRGFALIAECLDKNKKLQDLKVTITMADIDDPFYVEACKKLEKSLACMKNLTSLSFQAETAYEDTPFPPEIIHGLEGNKCLTNIDFQWEYHRVDKEVELAIYYSKRNIWCPKLINAATKSDLVDHFIEMKNDAEEKNVMSIVFEALRRKDGFW